MSTISLADRGSFVTVVSSITVSYLPLTAIFSSSEVTTKLHNSFGTVGLSRSVGFGFLFRSPAKGQWVCCFPGCVGFECGRKGPKQKDCLLFPFLDLGMQTLWRMTQDSFSYSVFPPKINIGFNLKLAPLTLGEVSWLAERCSNHVPVDRGMLLQGWGAVKGAGDDASWQELQGALPWNHTMPSLGVFLWFKLGLSWGKNPDRKSVV